jgi:uncharacterized protein (TIGR04141 family)
MPKSRSFSIYLLKEGYDATNSLTDNHGLEREDANALPEGASLFVLDSPPRAPWWKGYFGIEQELTQVTNGALVFLQFENRCFTLSFGHVSHSLREVSYEHDFGLKVTLNSLDPTKLKSTDVLEPSAARRRRTQVPTESDLTFFDFDRDSTVLKSLTGKVKEEHRHLFKHATGASNLRISTDVAADELAALCGELKTLYESEEYKTTFPDIQNIMPVRDPVLIERLNATLLRAFAAGDNTLNLVVPALINYDDNVYAGFSGAGASRVYEDVQIRRYYEYLHTKEIPLGQIGIEQLQKHQLLLTDEDGSPRDRFSIYKSLVFETSLDDAVYHLADGNWYRVEASYIEKLEAYLDPLCTDIDLPPYTQDTEGAYNRAAAAGDIAVICLDTTSIGPAGQTAVEPCDLYRVQDGDATFCHVKVSTLSSQLSHLFNQGTNAIELLRSEPEAVQKLRALLRERAGGTYDAMVAPLAEERHRVLFAIVTHRPKNRKSKNLPVFSRISLMRSMKAVRLMRVKANFGFIEDRAIAVTRERERKRR